MNFEAGICLVLLRIIIFYILPWLSSLLEMTMTSCPPAGDPWYVSPVSGAGGGSCRQCHVSGVGAAQALGAAWWLWRHLLLQSATRGQGNKLPSTDGQLWWGYKADNVCSMSELVQPQEGRRSVQVSLWIETFDLQRVSMVRCSPWRARQARAPWISRRGQRPETRVRQKNWVRWISCPIMAISFGQGRQTNIYQKRKLLSVLSCVLFGFLLFQAKFHRAKKRGFKRKCQALKQENGSNETGRQTFVLFSDFQHSIRFDVWPWNFKPSQI